MKTINEMNLEELREALVNAKSQLAEANERVEKAESEARTFRESWTYVTSENEVMKKKIESLKTIVSLL